MTDKSADHWEEIPLNIVDDLRRENSSYFEYEGYLWKSGCIKVGQAGQLVDKCLRIRKI